MIFIPSIIHFFWKLSTVKDTRFFYSCLKSVHETQWQILHKIISINRETDFGINHHFDRIHSESDWKDRVPIRRYEEFGPWIERTAQGEKNVLTSDDILLMAPTGGSTAGSKLIPYTNNLKHEFQRAINTWIADLYSTIPQLKTGKQYWLISPILREERYTSGGIPIGFNSDLDYLSGLGKLISRIFAVPFEVSLLKELYEFRYVTSLFLLRERNLTLISVWNPTFFTLLLDFINSEYESLLDDIARGTVGLAGGESELFRPYLSPDPERADV